MNLGYHIKVPSFGLNSDSCGWKIQLARGIQRGCGAYHTRIQ